MKGKELPIPPHFSPDRVGEVWNVPYQDRAMEAAAWAREHNIQPAYRDTFKTCLLLVDVQNTFCLPNFELFVAGRSGNGAVEDNQRLCQFIYRNLHRITDICPTMDTHQAMQIFHAIFFVNEHNEHPAPFTLISVEDISTGKWRFNPALCQRLGWSEEEANRYIAHYVSRLKESGKYELTIWPYHAMLGGIGHALVPAVEEAIFFHTLARNSQPDFQIKGDNPLTENYSVLRPEILTDHKGGRIAQKNEKLIQKLIAYDAVIVAGQAKSHCVAWTVEDLLNEMIAINKNLPRKVYLLEDCTSPVVVPGVIDYTDAANDAFQKFAEMGAHLVKSTEPMDAWPGMAS